MTQTLRVIIAGGGRVGFQTAAILSDRGEDVTIVEPDPTVVEEISREWMTKLVTGDATNPDILQQAGVGRADVVAALTGESGLNLAICMAAAELNPSVRTVARTDEADDDSYTEFVDEVVFPERAGARLAANRIVGADVETIADITAGPDIMQVRVAEGAPAAGKRLADVRFPHGTLVVSDEGSVAAAETTLTPGERYLLAVERDVVDEVLQLLRG